jgi:hypothetical protein
MFALHKKDELAMTPGNIASGVKKTIKRLLGVVFHTNIHQPGLFSLWYIISRQEFDSMQKRKAQTC